jgi:hypothetical protein
MMLCGHWRSCAPVCLRLGSASFILILILIPVLDFHLSNQCCIRIFVRVRDSLGVFLCFCNAWIDFTFGW